MSESKDAPERIYLQWHGDGEPDEEPPVEVSWCEDKIFTHDVEYVRRDLLDSENYSS